MGNALPKGPIGPKGATGPKGEKGDIGPPGRSLTSINIENGMLKGVFSDNSSVILGAVGGPKGDPGTPGKGISNIQVDKDKLKIIYTDNTTVDIPTESLSDSVLQKKTMWCADGVTCQVPSGATGIDVINNGFIIKQSGTYKMGFEKDATKIWGGEKGTAVHGGVMVNEGGGVTVGAWEKAPEGVLKIAGQGASDDNDGTVRAGDHFGAKGLHVVGHKAGGDKRRVVLYGDLDVNSGDGLKFNAPGGLDSQDGTIRAGDYFGSKGLHVVGHKAGGETRQTLVYGDLLVINGNIKQVTPMGTRTMRFEYN